MIWLHRHDACPALRSLIAVDEAPPMTRASD
jgi:hypothetical protein